MPFRRHFTTLFTTFATPGDILRRKRRLYGRSGRIPPLSTDRDGLRDAEEVSAMPAVRGWFHRQFMYFQREGANECGTGGILIHCGYKVNTFVYFYIVF